MTFIIVKKTISCVTQKNMKAKRIIYKARIFREYIVFRLIRIFLKTLILCQSTDKTFQNRLGEEYHRKRNGNPLARRLLVLVNVRTWK